MTYAMKKTLLIKIDGICFLFRYKITQLKTKNKNHRWRTNAVDILTVELILDHVNISSINEQKHKI